MIALLRIIFNLIRKDTAILYPPMITAFISLWLLFFLKIDINNIQLNSSLVLYFSISWVMNIFTYLLTSELCNKTLQGNLFSFKTALKKTTFRFIPAALGAGFIILLSVGILLAASASQLATIIISPLIMFFSLLYILFPIIYVISEQKIWRIYKILFSFIKNNFRTTLNIFFFIIFIIGIKLILTTLFQAMPANIKSILIPVTEGFFTVVNIFGIIIFWQANNSKIKVRI